MYCDPGAGEGSDAVVEYLEYITSSIISTCYCLVGNSLLYSLNNRELGDATEVMKCLTERRMFLLGFWEVPLRLMDSQE